MNTSPTPARHYYRLSCLFNPCISNAVSRELLRYVSTSLKASYTLFLSILFYFQSKPSPLVASDAKYVTGAACLCLVSTFQ